MIELQRLTKSYGDTPPSNEERAVGTVVTVLIAWTSAAMFFAGWSLVRSDAT